MIFKVLQDHSTSSRCFSTNRVIVSKWPGDRKYPAHSIASFSAKLGSLLHIFFVMLVFICVKKCFLVFDFRIWERAERHEDRRRFYSLPFCLYILTLCFSNYHASDFYLLSFFEILSWTSFFLRSSAFFNKYVETNFTKGPWAIHNSREI